jgi:adenylate cyclase
MAVSPDPTPAFPWQKIVTNGLERLGHPIVMATAAAAALVLGGRALGLLQGAELATYDQLLRSRPSEAPDDRLLVVGITEADIQARQEWPISDQTVAEVLDVILAAEPVAVGLDLFRDVPIEPGREALLETLASSPLIVGVCKVSSADNAGVAPPPGMPADRIGFSDLPVDPGGILRRSLVATAPPPLDTSVGDHVCNTRLPGAPQSLFSLSARLSFYYFLAQELAPELTDSGDIRVGTVTLSRLDGQVGGYQRADTEGYQTLLNYRAAEAAVPQVSLTQVLTGEVPPEMFRDRIVLIGATTPEAKDAFYTPYSGGQRDSQQMPGVMVHAQATSQLISAVLDDRALIWSWPDAVEGLWIALWGLGGAIFAWYVRRPIWFALGTAAFIGGLYGSCYLLFVQGGWIPWVPAAIALLAASGVVVLVDRFNKSDYGRAVYRQVKSFLKLNIEIDESRVGEQVAEITETQYFSDLQQRARDLRQKREQPDQPSKPKPPASPEASDEMFNDYLGGLRQNAQRLHPPDRAPEDADDKADG